MIRGIEAYNNTLTQTNDVTKLLGEQKGINGRGNGSDIGIIEGQQNVSGEEVDHAIKITYSSVHYRDYTRYQDIARIIHQEEAFRNRLYKTKDVITKVEDIIDRRMKRAGVEGEFKSPGLPKEEMTIGEIQEYIKPENVAGRIVDFAKGLYGMWKSNHPDAEPEKFDGFFNVLKGAIDEGFKQARDILGVLPDDIESMINETYDLTMQGMDDWYKEIMGKRPGDNPVIKVESGESVAIQGQLIEAINDQIEIIQNDDGVATLNLKEGQSARVNGNLIEATDSDLTIAISEEGARLHLLEGQKVGINDRFAHALSGNFILALEGGIVRVDLNEEYTVKVDEEEVKVIKGKSNLNIFQDGRVCLDISPYSIVNLNGQEIKTDNDQITIDLLKALLLNQQKEDLIPEVPSTYGKQEANIPV
ncbi:MAG: DUF5610 domain-containing protein [bacterium]|nr:DUF5610 domain-containing protein [bacterium]